jgi:hypothetical protein
MHHEQLHCLTRPRRATCHFLHRMLLMVRGSVPTTTDIPFSRYFNDAPAESPHWESKTRNVRSKSPVTWRYLSELTATDDTYPTCARMSSCSDAPAKLPRRFPAARTSAELGCGMFAASARRDIQPPNRRRRDGKWKGHRQRRSGPAKLYLKRMLPVSCAVGGLS